MARIAYMDDTTISPAGKAEWERMRGARGSAPGHLYQLLAHSPQLMARWAALAETLRGYDRDVSIVLDARSRELAIVQVAHCAGAEYEWAAHLPIAMREGLTQEQAAALTHGDLTPFSPKDRALLAYAASSTNDVIVSDATFAALRVHFDERQILELTVTIAFYNCVARVLEGLAIDLDPGMQPMRS